MSPVILEVNGLNIHYEMEFHRSDSLRELFVGILKGPLLAIFGNRDVLHIVKDFNLTLRKGERLGIIGINGAGKTSLCRAIAGMLYPASGEITVEGEVRAIFDANVGIQWELTGRENAMLLSRFFFPWATRAQLREIVDEALEFSELGVFVDVPFKNYSRGMQARLGLSLVTSRPTDLLILDEVFDGADHFFQEKVSARTLNMIEHSGAVILVSHNPQQLELACNRAIVLDRQGILFDGDVQQAIEYYQLWGRGEGDGLAGPESDS